VSLVYKVEYSQEARKQLKKLDKQIANTLLNWVEQRLVSCENPRLWGKSLTGSLNEKWRYRVGDYRILCVIKDHIVTIEVVSIGHRKEIYK
jgi:mRNA interferase RelE/StbE